MQEDRNLQPKHQENEVDLGVFFTLISKVFKKVGAFFSAILSYLSEVILFFLFLIKRNILWLALSAALGFAFGLYQYHSSGPSFYSDLVVRTNFESSRLLYQKIDYFNALVKEGHRKKLAEIFGINEDEAGKLVSFQIEPVDDPLEAAKLYKNSFLSYKHVNIAADTSWANTITYKEFVKNLTKYDYPLHTIRLSSRSAIIYSDVQNGLLKMIQNSASLQGAKEANIEMLRKEEQILTASLNGLDSLRKSYNKKIGSDAQGVDGKSVVFAQGTARAPEIDLYDKELMLKDELMAVKSRISQNQDIVQVYADFNSVGTRVPKFKESFIIYALLSALTAFVIILLIKFSKYLNIIDQKRGFR